jgi:hypothetical protein
MRQPAIASVCAIAASGAMAMVSPRQAHACGGCFVAAETNTVVTDHRMIFSVSRDKTTLHDQIRYEGSPESFAWVLPIAGDVEVGISSDAVFAALDANTTNRVITPPTQCPPPPNCRGRGGGSFAAAEAPRADAGASSNVTVHKQETVGPYETVQLSADDPRALDLWLSNNRYVVPDVVKPVIAAYVAERSRFLAMKLVPGAAVSAMRPVRITTQGAGTTLPLRMIAAGTGPNVGITMWILGEGRYEPSNFPTFTIENRDLTWDWNQGRSNYSELRAARTAASSGRAWEVENSTVVARQNVESWVNRVDGREGAGYEPLTDEDGQILVSAVQMQRRDIDSLFGGGLQARVTRVRADLAQSALTTDLVIGASRNQGELPTLRQPENEIGQPQCPIFEGCRQVGTAPRDRAIEHAAEQERALGSCACDVAGKSSAPGVLGLSLGASALIAGAFRARRRRP